MFNKINTKFYQYYDPNFNSLIYIIVAKRSWYAKFLAVVVFGVWNIGDFSFLLFLGTFSVCLQWTLTLTLMPLIFIIFSYKLLEFFLEMEFELLDTATNSLTGVMKLSLNLPHLSGVNSFSSLIKSLPDNPIHYNTSDSKHTINLLFFSTWAYIPCLC